MKSVKRILGGLAIFIISAIVTLFFLFIAMGIKPADMSSAIKFIYAFSIVKHESVDTVTAKSLFDGAVKGMVESLKDQHSVYLDKDSMNTFMMHTEGEYGGVGIYLGQKDKELLVIAPMDGTPAERAGVKSGDRIIKIDGISTIDMDSDVAANKIRGKAGTVVKLTLLRGKDTKEVELKRELIEIKTVAGKMLDNNIAYIRISAFNENTGAEFDKEWKKQENDGAKAIILDLRENPGGLLTECVDVAKHFVPKGPIVTVVDRNGNKEEYDSELVNKRFPLVVLVDGGSASASEIIAGAVQDTKSGTLIGEKTYGKGSVQTIFRLGDGTGIKLTIAKYATPLNRFIDGIGVEPDIKVALPVNATAANDTQLDKALEILKSKLK
ncbi:MAG: S41 family peptidase [Negativicutes bacterium]|jgi:carboxyl-terminal processing protease